eukprot:gene13500-18114_t
MLPLIDSLSHSLRIAHNSPIQCVVDIRKKFYGTKQFSFTRINLHGRHQVSDSAINKNNYNNHKYVPSVPKQKNSHLSNKVSLHPIYLSRKSDDFHSMKLYSYLPEFTAGVAGFDAKILKASLTINFEKDVLGMINFCLRISDNALSGPSRSKLLNEITNDVFKSIMIGFDPIIEETVNKLLSYRDSIARIDPDSNEDEIIKVENQLNDTVPVTIPVPDSDLLAAYTYLDRLETLLVNGTTCDAIIGGIYDKGYRSLLTVLRDGGCSFKSAHATRPVPIDKNICLSVLDIRSSNWKSKTKELNKLANVVSRCILYGSIKDRNHIANYLENMTEPFSQEWLLDGNSQEIRFIKVLSLFLREDLSTAQAALLGELVPQSSLFGSSVINGGISAISQSVLDENNNNESLKLQDAYLNAFDKVVEACLTDINSQSGSVPQNEEIVTSVIEWEQNLRRNLTVDLWNPNPLELAGEWELVNVAGVGSLKPIMTGSSEMYFGMTQGPGPAHLDTCEFFIMNTARQDLILKYVGFIDRGQRLESRFSKSPIKMTGRVFSFVRGEPKGSSRFVMALRQPLK